ncbi:MAG: hypothetical protein QW320_00300 [Ignisphaera sp.]
MFKISYTSRGRYRTSRRNLDDLVKLAKTGKELIDLYIEVVEWKGFQRVLAIKM